MYISYAYICLPLHFFHSTPVYLWITTHTYAAYQRLYRLVYSFITFMFFKAQAIGAALGGAIGIALYHTVPAYQSFINYQLQLIGF